MVEEVIEELKPRTVSLETVLALAARKASVEVDADTPLIEAGLDSLDAVELRHELQEALGEVTPCETIVTQTVTNRNANSVLGRACARSSTLYTQRHTPRLHRLMGSLT